jgi:hypothetical protein
MRTAFGMEIRSWASAGSSAGGVVGTVVRVEVEFAGEEGWVRLDIAASGRVEHATLRVGPLRGELDITVGVDVPRLREDLQTILSSATISGSTTLESVEHDFRLRVVVERGKGVIEGEITQQFESAGGLTFRLTTDQTYLRSTLQQVDALVRYIANPS